MLGPLALAAASIAALAIGQSYEVWSFGSPGAGLLPCIAAALLLVTSLLALLERASGERAPADAEPVAGSKVAGYGIGLIVLPPAILVLGMLPALGLFVLVLLRAAEGARWRTAIAVAVASTALSWLLFVRLLRVPLPGSVFW
jgi:hypothetical protein